MKKRNKDGTYLENTPLAIKQKIDLVINTILARMNASKVKKINQPFPNIFVAQVCLKLSDYIDACLLASGQDEEGFVKVNTWYLFEEIIKPTANIYLEREPDLLLDAMSSWGMELCVEIINCYKEIKPFSKAGQGIFPKYIYVKWI